MADSTIEVALEGPAAATERSPAKDSWRRFRRHKLALASLAFLIVLAAVGILSSQVSGQSPTAMVNTPLGAPSAAHLMGTDSLGRDLWARVAQGARISLIVGLGSQAIALTIGLLIGAVAGFAGGLIDSLLMRLTDIMLALPSLLFAMLFLTVFGTSIPIVTTAIGFATWPVIARLERGQVLQVKELEFVQAAYSVGCSERRVLVRHIFPNTLAPVIVQITFGISQAIFMEAFLAFLGLGAQPPTPSWGRLLTEGFSYVQVDPSLVIFPTLAITLTLLAVNFVGDGLRDALEPGSN